MWRSDWQAVAFSGFPTQRIARKADRLRITVASRNQSRFGKKLIYLEAGCQCRLNKGGVLFRRKRYQQGSLNLEERKRGPAVWAYRWWEKVDGKPIRRKLHVGTLKQYRTESQGPALQRMLLAHNQHAVGIGEQIWACGTAWLRDCGGHTLIRKRRNRWLPQRSSHAGELRGFSEW